MFVSLAHGDEEIDRTIEAVGDFFAAELGVWETLAAEAAAESPLWGELAPARGRARARARLLAARRGAVRARVETIYEGYLLHYGRSRLFAPADADTALLLGDYLYAHGLVRIAATGSVEAVHDLAELISLCAQAARRRRGRARPRRGRRRPRCSGAGVWEARAVSATEAMPGPSASWPARAAGAEAVERAAARTTAWWGKVWPHARVALVPRGCRRGRPQGRALDARRRADLRAVIALGELTHYLAAKRKARSPSAALATLQLRSSGSAGLPRARSRAPSSVSREPSDQAASNHGSPQRALVAPRNRGGSRGRAASTS